MASYTVIVTKTAQKQLDKLPVDIGEALLDSMEELAIDPRPPGCKKLKGREGYRIRRGDYRIIYTVADNILIVRVIAVGHRKDIYQ